MIPRPDGTLALGAIPIVLGSGILLALRWRLNLLPLSDEEARASGVRIGALRAVCILCATAITAACVSMSGQVGWVGLLAPHVCRMKFGNNHLSLLPACISLGAVFMMLVDTGGAVAVGWGHSALGFDGDFRRTIFHCADAPVRGVAAMKLEVRGGLLCLSEMRPPDFKRDLLLRRVRPDRGDPRAQRRGENDAAALHHGSAPLAVRHDISGRRCAAGVASGTAVAYDRLRAPERAASAVYTVEETVLLGRSARIGPFALPGQADVQAAEAAMDRLRLLPLRRQTMQRPFRRADAAGAAGPGAGQ